MIVLLSAAVCLPLLFVRRVPLTAALVTGVVAMVGTGIDVGWPGRLVAVAGFCLAAFHRHTLWPVLVATPVWTFVFATLAGSQSGVLPVTDLVIMGMAPVAVGYGLRLQRERSAQSARIAMAEDRARLARDVHDSVGHHLTAIKLQATAARRVPAGADRALTTITDISATALTEVRGLVGELRAQEDISALAERLSGPGRRITTRGSVLGLPPTVAHTAYRIVQEALTNAVRHSAATEIEVRLERERRQLAVLVSDNGSGAAAAAATDGNGLRGIRERVARLGGFVHIGPSESGWRVEARLPVRR
ncbi:signal transduction histidine kinase [Saccharothrix tamanrassetensis]|uniref:histidine kinase n=1 Tax=Saccharothrix tamanrassetensis TaxID=1051531 RepID=A0A841CKF2_9PSEU|nr:sensor histidine kinase [Saccharothrix tamanrassetensis]MBB5956844.1 signal transduction histidine kinase [Saccharothrix tamanrassetensis]